MPNPFYFISDNSDKKYINKLSLAIFCGFLLTSCKTVIKSHTADYDLMYVTKTGIKQRPLVTDLEVGKTKVTFTKTYENVSVKDAKENALGDFIQQNNCDIAVQPFFETNSVSENEKTSITVTLIAYPAFYRNIRNFEQKDTSAFLLHSYYTYNAVNVPAIAPVVPETKAVATATETKVFQKVKNSNGSKFGISASAAMPMGIYKDYYKMGLGFSLKYSIPLNKQADLTFNATQLSFGGKEVRYYYPGGSYTYTEPNLSSTSAKIGYKYNAPYNVFVEPQLGYTFFSDESGFSYALNVGYNLTKKVEVGLVYDHTSLSSEGFNYLGIKAGIYF